MDDLSTVSFFGKLMEETKIRIHNQQNILLVISLVILHSINSFIHKIKLK